jgi:dihydropteroate synthase
MLLRARDCTWTFPRPVLLMGVVNVTPDSFSDGGRYFNPDAAVEHALELVAEGADIIDVGGESTRPGASPVPEPEELRRVLPVLEKLARRIRVPISIDTMKPAVARAALQAGASLINDVAAHRQDEAMWRVAAEFGAGYVLMHMQGRPQDMQKAPSYGDVVAEVDAFFGDRLQRIAAAGLAPEQVILDVGIGFGKMREHNLQLLARLDSFTSWSRPLLLGASRKSIIPQVTGADPATDRLAGSLACACWGVQQGANILRIHDVAATRQAVQLTEAIRAQSRTSQPPPRRRNDEKA